MRPDGTDATALTEGDTDSRAPRWSPDGNQVIFNFGKEGDEQLNVMDADGSNAHKLSPGDFAAFGAWTKGTFTSMNVQSATRAPATTKVPPVAGSQPTQPPPAGSSGNAKLIFVNQLSTTLHITASGPTSIDVNIAPNGAMTFNVSPGTYVLTASAQERIQVSHTVTLQPGGQFTWVLHG